MYHCTALGKAFMARWDAPMRQAIYDSCGLPGQTPHTMTEIDALEAQLAGIRDRHMPEEAADAAISALDSKDFGDRNLKVNEAKPRENRSGGGGGGVRW